MSEKIEITAKFIEKVSEQIHKKDTVKLEVLINDLHIADVAEILQEIPISDAQLLYQFISEKKSAEILLELDDDLREDLLSDLSAKEIAEDVIENLETDDAADVIGEFSEERQEEVLAYIEDQEHASDISDLLSYKDDTAGGLMAKELIKVNQSWNTIRCLKEMRKQAEYVKKVHTIYVVDDNEVLLGTMSLRRLLLTQTNISIKEILRNEIISVKASEDDETVANIMNKYDLVVLPVINEKGQLVGRITIDDVIDLIKEEAEKDYQIASGITESVESRDTVFTLIKARIPWLLIGLVGGIIGAKIVGFFLKNEEDLELAFIPLIAAMAGNIGIQSAAIVVQELASNKNMENWSKKFFKELSIASINGIICGILIFFFCSFFYESTDFYFPLRMSISLVTVMIYAALFGTFIPLFFHRLNINPALATGPFITTMNDVVGLFIYFLICNYLFIP